jgi:25S rRNA (uracil2634-N3)-methyltransferase
MAKGKKSSLKSTLQSQQSRLKSKQRAEHAAQVAQQNSTKNQQSKGKRKAPPLPSTIPFKPTDRILLIGEGNFSFARALTFNPPAAVENLPPGNVTATTFDAEEDCYVKYLDAQIIVQELRENGVEVLFGVDATKLEKVSALKGRKWDRIVWNFPHAGECYLGFMDTRYNISQERASQIRTGTS